MQLMLHDPLGARLGVFLLIATDFEQQISGFKINVKSRTFKELP